MRKVFLFLLFAVFALSAMAQRERNYVYLLDCTQSMQEPNRIWDATKQYLKDDITRLSDESEVSVVPFQTKAYAPISFKRADFDWGAIEKKIEEYIKERTHTGICNAWDAGVKLMDPAKDNYFFLLTDGVDNVSGMDAVCKRISEWCAKYRNCYGFYVMLCEAAKSEALQNAVGSCKTFSLIDANGHPSPIGTFYPKEVRVNTLTYDAKRLTFSDEGDYEASVKCDDELFGVELDGGIRGGYATLKVVPRLSKEEISRRLMGQESYLFTADILPKGIQMDNPTLTVEVINKPERALTMVNEEQDMGKATHYGSFLFWKAKEPDTLTVDLKAAFNGEARKDGSRVEMQCRTVKGEEGYTLLYNGRPCEAGSFVMSPEDEASVLSVVFAPEAEGGKRYLEIAPARAENLDVVNDTPTADFNVSLRARYGHSWNPLQTILFWLLVALLAALLFWLLVVKPIKYQTFKKGARSLQVHDPITRRETIRGSRRVVFTDKRQKQGWLNRLFTGKIVYIVHEQWKDGFEMVPGSKGGTIVAAEKWNVSPSRTLEPEKVCKLTHKDTKAETKIEIKK